MKPGRPAAGIRPIVADDVAGVVAMVHALAYFERAPGECHLAAPDLAAALFGPAPALLGHVAELDGELAGFALWFLNFSTWEGRHGIYLEDLFVAPERRRHGIGLALLRTLGAVCRDRGYARLEWSVLDWNTPAQGFYRSLGAEEMHDWHVWRLTGAPLTTPT